MINYNLLLHWIAMKPRDYIAMALTFTVCVVLIGVFVREWWIGEELSIERVHIVSGLFGGIIAIIASYIGGKSKGDK